MSTTSPYITKEEWIEFWHIPADQADKAWEQKCELDWKVYSRTGKERNADIIPDIQPYRSMIDGSIISSRSHHRRHLKEHGCIEVGNEIKAATTPREKKRVDWKPEIIRRVYEAKH